MNETSAKLNLPKLRFFNELLESTLTGNWLTKVSEIHLNQSKSYITRHDTLDH